MDAKLFMAKFLEIQRRFDYASARHLATPWFRPFKTHYWLKQMRQATKEMEELGNYADALHKN